MRWIVAAALVIAGTGLAGANEASGTLVVVGDGVIAVTPDMATIQVGITSEAETAGEALDETSVVTGELLTLLSEMGIEQRDLQTSNLSLSPIWSDRGSGGSYDPEIRGYRADNTVRVRVRAIGDLGAILDDIVTNGANRFNGLSFDVQDPRPLEDQAKVAAVQDAQAKAALIADAAGVTLGRILSIGEAGAQPPGPMPMIEAARVTSVPVASGELEIRAQVTIVYAISEN